MVPGVVIEAVAALFFKQASDTRRRATEYFDKLRLDKQIARSIIIANSIEDENLKSAVKAQISLAISGIKTNNIDIKDFVVGSSQN